jgi:hypothetical protein
MFNQTGTDVVPLTREFAVMFSRLPSLHGDRNRDSITGKARIAWLARLLDDGLFYSPSWATAEVDGVTYRVNGGHSSQMLASRESDFPPGMTCIIQRFHCDDEADLANLFDQFDQRRSLRSISDKIKAHCGAASDLKDIPVSRVRYICAGIAYYMMNDGKESRLEEEERVRLIHEHEDYILFAHGFAVSRTMVNAGVQAAIYATWLRCSTSASDFWHLVQSENAPQARHSSRVLANFLRDGIGKKKPGTGSSKWTTRAFFCKSVYAWNAYRTGLLINKLRYFANVPWPVVK